MALISGILFIFNMLCIGLRWDQQDILLLGNVVGAVCMLFIFAVTVSDDW
jgi:hypothetical protein